jgi:hypothetical protein
MRAAKLYEAGKLSLGQAARTVGLSYRTFYELPIFTGFCPAGWNKALCIKQEGGIYSMQEGVMELALRIDVPDSANISATDAQIMRAAKPLSEIMAAPCAAGAARTVMCGVAAFRIA